MIQLPCSLSKVVVGGVIYRLGYNDLMKTKPLKFMKTGETKVIFQRERGSMSGDGWDEFLALEKLNDTEFLK